MSFRLFSSVSSITVSVGSGLEASPPRSSTFQFTFQNGVFVFLPLAAGEEAGLLACQPAAALDKLLSAV